MKTKISSLLSVSIILIGLLASCEYEKIVPKVVTIPDTQVITYAEIQAVFTTQGCTACHGSSGGLSLAEDKSYNSLISKNLVNTEAPENSIILTKIAPGHYGKTYTPEQSALILAWIKRGAKKD